MLIDPSELDIAISEGIVLILFSAQTSSDSNQVRKVMGEIREKYKGNLEVFEVDLDESPKTVTNYDIQKIPTVGIFMDGSPKVKIEGVYELSFYEEQLRGMYK